MDPGGREDSERIERTRESAWPVSGDKVDRPQAEYDQCDRPQEMMTGQERNQPGPRDDDRPQENQPGQREPAWPERLSLASETQPGPKRTSLAPRESAWPKRE